MVERFNVYKPKVLFQDFVTGQYVCSFKKSQGSMPDDLFIFCDHPLQIGETGLYAKSLTEKEFDNIMAQFNDTKDLAMKIYKKVQPNFTTHLFQQVKGTE